MKGLTNVLKEAYSLTPDWAKRAISIVPFQTRMGAHYRSTFASIHARQQWSVEQWQHYQFRELKGLLSHAYRTVPFYKQTFEGVGFDPDEIKRLEDLAHLPFVSKDQIRASEDRMVSTTAQLWKCYRQNTGGSSGTPLSFWLDPESSYEEWAYLIAMWERARYKEYDRIATLRGHNLGDKVFRYDPMFNEVILSSYNLTEANIGQYIDCLNSWKPKFLRGYPSAIAQLAELVAGAKQKIDVRITAALCGSEALLENQKRTIEQAFDCSCYHWYGHTERVILAGWGAKLKKFHCFPDYGITEIIDYEGKPITQPGVVGELVGTGLLNTAMPLIRYKTGDLASWAEQRDDQLPGYPVLQELRGRTGEYVELQGGQRVPITALIYGQHLDIFEHVSSLQLYQGQPGAISVLVVPRKGDLPFDIVEQTVQTLESACQRAAKVEVFQIRQAQKTRQGKFKTLISEAELDVEIAATLAHRTRSH